MSINFELFIYFATGLAFTLFMPVLFPALKLFYMIPFLIRSYYLKPLSTALWLSLWTGVLLDLFSAGTRFGLHSTVYVFTTYFLYSLKKNFFEDSFTTLPVMCFLFSVVSTLFNLLLLSLLDTPVVPSLSFLFTDLLLMPMGDMIFALLVFSLPALLFGKRIRKGSDYFMENQ